MPKIYLVRHGESVWNVEKKVAGFTDVPLTEKGQKQAVELAKNIRDLIEKAKVNDGDAGDFHDFKIDEILYSPLARASETAKQIAEYTGIPSRCEPRLAEQNFGKYEGSDRSSANKEFFLAKTQFINHYGNGETMLHLCQRVFNLLDELRSEEIRSNKNYLLVSHGGIARMIHAYFNDMTNEEFAAFKIANCEIKEYDFLQS